MTAPTEDTTLSTLKWGEGALAANVSGRWIVAIGANALHSSVDCDLQYAIGDNVLVSCVTGCSFNGGIGQGSLAFLETGICNWGFGIETLHLLAEGSSNTAGGQAALRRLEAGSQNTAWGEQGLSSLNSGSNNLGIGYTAGSALEYGSNNIIIGANAQPSVANVSNEATFGDGNIIVNRFSGKFQLNGEDQGV